MDDKRDVREIERGNEPLDVSDMVEEAVLEIRFVGLAKSDQVWCDTPPTSAHVRNDVSP